jgi:hypothetical protein
LGADLYRLTVVAQRHFPTVAGDFGAAHAAVAGTVGMEGGLRRPAYFGGSVGPAMSAWSELRDHLASVLGQTRDNLNGVADALLLAVQVFANADQAAASELARLQSVNGQPTPEPAVGR